MNEDAAVQCIAIEHRPATTADAIAFIESGE
jgi:hypothetical protein